FACGIVVHPAIDACLQLRREHGLRAGDIAAIELRVHPLVLELTGKKEPEDGLQGKFSVYHGFALGLVFGRAGESEYSDEIVRREDIVALRRKVDAVADPSIDETAADVTVILRGGAKKHVFVEHAIGSLARPMSDADLEAKFHALADPVLGETRTRALVGACWNLSRARDVRALCEGARA
ncbi:MAG TPA: hypothetical protein VLY46_09610, partial [Usitatibacter sp.]|nr:hypothetical protein [Usitatibacter sp.]